MKVQRQRDRRNEAPTDEAPVNEAPIYDHDLSVREILTLHSQRTQDQIDRFPSIPLPFGEAYYQALQEQA